MTSLTFGKYLGNGTRDFKRLSDSGRPIGNHMWPIQRHQILHTGPPHSVTPHLLLSSSLGAVFPFTSLSLHPLRSTSRGHLLSKGVLKVVTHLKFGELSHSSGMDETGVIKFYVQALSNVEFEADP